VHSLPVDRLGAVVADDIGSVTKKVDLDVVCGTDHLMTGCAETHRRNSSVRLSGYGSVAEGAVEPETVHLLSIGCDSIEGKQ
jgi:hypothetical protein